MTDLKPNKENLVKEAGCCSVSYFRDTYTCSTTRKHFQWIGKLPEYCPRCGKPIKDRYC